MPDSTSHTNNIQAIVDSTDTITAQNDTTANLISLQDTIVTDSIVSIPEATRFDGIPRTQDFFKNDIFISLILLFAVFISLIIASQRKARVKYLDNLLNTNNNQQTLTIREYGDQLILGIFAIIGYSLLACECFFGKGNWETLGLCAGGFILFLIAKYTLLYLYMRTFFPTEQTRIVKLYETLLNITGLIAFFGYICVVFMPHVFLPYIYALLILIAVTFCIIVIYIFFTRFFNKYGLILRFILYLCTLEILPIAVLIKALSEVNGLIN
ncbi:MAG: DUF4271 domain-containing protein [Bacteroidia bacterium]|nr:DUF4271 domain-containing protein [Bacteroidia bacterium]